MKFMGREVPGALFKLARDYMLSDATVTPEDVRVYLLSHGSDDLNALSDIKENHRVIVNRVFQVARKELIAAGKISQLKRGVWAKTSFLKAANAAGA